MIPTFIMALEPATIIFPGAIPNRGLLLSSEHANRICSKAPHYNGDAKLRHSVQGTDRLNVYLQTSRWCQITRSS